uniref:Transposase (putative) gypsy type domain-containing protein n=1 Tax=Arundo donax TaxID=35708 RepID=A0A0A9D193_ARUDO
MGRAFSTRKKQTHHSPTVAFSPKITLWIGEILCSHLPFLPSLLLCLFFFLALHRRTHIRTPPLLDLVPPRISIAMALSPKKYTVYPDQSKVWRVSTTSEEDLQELTVARILPSKSFDWRSAEGEDFPTPKTTEVVAFTSFFACGFALLVSSFFRGLLHFYRIELTHLNPNSILQIALFVHLCKAYIAIPPHFNLLRWLFYLRPQPSKAAPK